MQKMEHDRSFSCATPVLPSRSASLQVQMGALLNIPCASKTWKKNVIDPQIVAKDAGNFHKLNFLVHRFEPNERRSQKAF
jgi:hypothetical protein